MTTPEDERSDEIDLDSIDSPVFLDTREPNDEDL